jgi:hypothetical protein
MYDICIINAIDTIIGWDQDSAFSCVRSLAELKLHD